MRFRSYDSLRVFVVAARHLSFTAAANELNLSKGAVSYQVARLEEALGFSLFSRGSRGLRLTDRGQRLFLVADDAFASVEREIHALRDHSMPVTSPSASRPTLRRAGFRHG